MLEPIVSSIDTQEFPILLKYDQLVFPNLATKFYNELKSVSSLYCSTDF